MIFSLQLTCTVLAIVDLLLRAGANVNVVANGHSPLSLAILNGYDTVSTGVGPHVRFIYKNASKYLLFFTGC